MSVCVSLCIVECRTVAMQRLRDRAYILGSFLGNGSVTTSPLLGIRFLIIQQLDHNDELCLLCRPCRDVINKGQGQFSQFCMAICEESICARREG
jgi:ferredoxin